MKPLQINEIAKAEEAGKLSSVTIDIDGSFSLKKSPCTISLTTDHLKWKKTNGKQDEEIPITDVLSVKADGSKKGVVDRFQVCYIERQKKHILRKTCVEFRGTSDACTEWNKHIQGRIDTIAQRPRRMLVLVNPVSGSGKGKKAYFKTVAPLFDLAGIQTDVIEIEKDGHIEDMLAKYDIKSIDSLVLVGGDGLYHEAVNGFVRRSVDESGIDINDPDALLPDVNITIGMIPCGIGNGMAMCNNGNNDIETAALSIIVGKTNPADYFGVYSCGSLVSYSSMLIGYGMWGDVLSVAESRCCQGTVRYPIAMAKVLLLDPQRQMDCSFECLPPGKPTSKSAEKSNWSQMNEVSYGVVTFGMHIFEDKPSEDSDTTASLELVIQKPCSRWAFIKNMVSVMNNKETVNKDMLKTHSFSQYKVKVTNPSDPESWNGKMEHILNIDGEIFHLKQPEYHVTHHPEQIKVFANTPKDWMKNCKCEE